MVGDTIGGVPAKFDNEDNREMILDIIDEYMDIVDAVKHERRLKEVEK